MTTCPNCNKELSDDAKFCGGCGTQLLETSCCANCDEQTSAESDTCQSCDAPVTEVSAEEVVAEEVVAEEAPVEEAPVEEAPVTVAAETKKAPKKGLLFGILGVAAVAVIAVAAFLLFGNGKSNANYALYVKDSEIFFTNLKSNSKPWEVTSHLVDSDDVDNETLSESGYVLGNASYMSEDGKYLFFPDKIDDDDDGLTIYYKKVSKPGAEAVKIDSDIQTYVVNKSATTVTYTKGEDGNLYQYNMAKDSKEKIAGEVDGFFVSDDGKKIIYVNPEGNVYLKVAGKDKEKLASEIDWIQHVSEDLTTVYYAKEDSLYKQVVGKDKEKIASDVSRIINIYNSGEVYYLTSETETIKLKDYVTDDKKAEDASITEPDYNDYSPDYSNYPSRWDYPTYEAYEAAYDAWDAESDRLWEAYYDAYERYWEKESRDELRGDLDDATMEWTNYSLHFYNGKDDTVITDDYSFYNNYATDVPVIAYAAYNKTSPEKIKLSDITSIYYMESMIEDALSASSERYVAVKDTATVIDPEGKAGSFRFNESGTALYYIDNIPEGEDCGDLYRASISGSKIETPEVYDTDVSRFFLYDDDIEYYKNCNEDDIGDLYFNKEEIDSDVYVYSTNFASDSNTLVYYTDWNEDKGCGTLNVYNGKKSETIADDVTHFSFTPNGKILYLYDYSTKNYKGELHQWSNGKSTKIDDDVVAIITIGSYKYRGN